MHLYTNNHAKPPDNTAVEPRQVCDRGIHQEKSHTLYNYCIIYVMANISSYIIYLFKQ